jgi:molybdopterin/thiamine biosynthesis adenylyltransferase
MADRHSEKLRTFAHLSELFPDGFPLEVAARRLRVIVGEETLRSEAGQVLVLTVARLVPRLCDKIDFVCPDSDCLPRLQPLLASSSFSGRSLAALSEMIWSDGQFTADSATGADVTVGIGGAAGDLHVGISADGEAVLSRSRGTAIDRADAIAAALSAAALAAGEATKLIYPELGGETIEEFTFGLGPFGAPLQSGELLRVERPVVAGVGAVGCAFIYALICLGATGSILLLDPDVVDDTNLMRYVLFDSRHDGIAKVDAAKQLIAASGISLEVESSRTILQSFLTRHPSERDRLRLLVSAVDSYEARRALAGELPRKILNAGTMPRDFTLSRHGFADGYACLACLYPARPEDADRAAVMARELGLPRSEIAELLRSKAGLNERQLTRAAEVRGLPSEQFSSWVGAPLDSFYHKEFCATAQVATARGEAVAPLAFGSAWAGFLLAEGLIADGDDRYFRIDTFVGLERPQRGSKRPRVGCVLCKREAYRRAYTDRWGH